MYLLQIMLFLVIVIATVFNNANQQINVYGDDIEVDYRGYEVCTHNNNNQPLAIDPSRNYFLSSLN